MFSCWKCMQAQMCPTLCDPWTVHTLPGSSVHGILRARILEWVAISSSRDLPNPGIKFMSNALQADSLPAEPSGSHLNCWIMYHNKDMPQFTPSLVDTWVISKFLDCPVNIPLPASLNTYTSVSPESVPRGEFTVWTVPAEVLSKRLPNSLSTKSVPEDPWAPTATTTSVLMSN